MPIFITPNAPTSSKYVLQTADSVLPNAQALSSLSSGIMKVTTTTGAVTSVAAPTGVVVGDTDTQTLTNKTFTTPTLQGTVDGWIGANEAWSYASASTITVPTGAASKYQVGDRIKWTQTTVRYGVIVAVADTLLTILVNNDYVVVNAAISANFYSHAQNPMGYPTWFAMAAPSFDLTAYDNGAGGAPTTNEFRCRIDGHNCTYHYSGTGTKKSSDNYIGHGLGNLPTPANYTTGVQCIGMGFADWTGNHVLMSIYYNLANGATAKLGFLSEQGVLNGAIAATTAITRLNCFATYEF